MHIRNTRALAGALMLGALNGCAERAPHPLTFESAPATRSAAAALPQVVIHEVLADPGAVSDDAGEWFEVYNPGSSGVDLQGWSITSGNDAPHTVSGSVVVPAGGYAVLARNGNKRKNGGVSPQYAYGTGITLANGGDWLVLKDAAGATVDSVAWSTMPGGAARGVVDASADNAAVGGANWTTQTSTYGKGDKGTPGAANDGAVVPITTVTVTPSSASMAVGATQQFAASATDANGGVVSTTYAWSSSDPNMATVDASGLATGVAAGTAILRATAPNGVYGEASVSVTAPGEGGGMAVLVINEVMPNPSAVTDAAGEWLEIHNPGSSSVDIQGWAVVSGNDAAHTVGVSTVVPAGGYVVLARSADRATNGGVSVAYAYGTGITLANSADWVVLRDGSGATADSVAWSSVPTGASRGVVDPSQDNADMAGSNWSTQTSLYGSGDKGTPGAQNDGAASPTPPGEPAVVTVSPASASIRVGAQQPFSVTAADAQGQTVSTTYTWTSSNVSVATVDANGVASGVAEGTTTLRATAANGVFGEATLSVTASTGGGGSASELVVEVLDIGQGDAIYIQNGTSRVFIDGGPDTTAFRQHLDRLGLRGGTVDMVIISHAHFDHYSGLRELFKTSNGITVRYMFENRDAGTAITLGELRDSINARVARGELIVRDTDDPCGDGRAVCTVTLNGGAKLHVMRPDPGGPDPNNRSTPVKLVGPDSASFSMWFAGDAEHEAIEWFDTGAEYDVFPGMKVNVLKANHHGSCNGVKRRYAELLDPDWVTFSLAANNSYGHVHQQTKDLFTQYGKPWYRTDQNGTITIRSAGTPGSGYTISGTRGSAGASGPEDRASTQAACNPLP